jgi:large subunit ribosomal protein L31
MPHTYKKKYIMKSNIHPTWNHTCTVTCACGNSFTTGSNTDTLSVDICSACHPFFTGEMRFVDRQGRVDKFLQKMQAAKSNTTIRKSAKKAQKKADQPTEDQKSYQEILREQQSQVKKTVAAPVTE